jgi:catechol 2,3-dioxygenase-like lactoylglutathione lyase family enzyme
MFEGIKHIVIFCKNTQKSKEWYHKLGFTYQRGYEGMHWFAINNMELMLHPVEDANPGYTTVHLKVKDVAELFNYVITQGLEPLDHQQSGTKISKPVKRQWGDIEFELIDPDGHKWAFTQG